MPLAVGRGATDPRYRPASQSDTDGRPHRACTAKADRGRSRTVDLDGFPRALDGAIEDQSALVTAALSAVTRLVTSTRVASSRARWSASWSGRRARWSRLRGR